jgi:ribosomal protein L18
MVNGRILDRNRWRGRKGLKQRIQIQPTCPMGLIQASNKKPSGQIALDVSNSREIAAESVERKNQRASWRDC